MPLSPPLTLNAWLRYDVLIRLLEPLDDVRTVLEIGAGEGALGSRLASRYRYIGLEPDPASFRLAEARFRRLGLGCIRNLSVEELLDQRAFDLVCAFEVLEHMEDDEAALHVWRGYVRPGGWILVSVPAWPSRWGALDDKAGHYRRYEPARLEEVLRIAGFVEPVVILYGFPLIYLVQPLWDLAARRALARGGSMQARTAASGRWLQPPEAFGLLTAALAAPFRLLQRPFARTRGTGLVALARRSATEALE